MQTLYTSDHICNLADNAEFNIWDNQITFKALKNIFEGFDVKLGIEPNLFYATWEILNDSIDEAISESQELDDFVQELKDNNAVFAAFKTYKQQNDIATLLVDDDGAVRSFAEFSKAAKPVADVYNIDYLRTEYTTAVRRADTAAKQKQYEKDKDLFPNMTWMPSRSPDRREIHKKFYGLTMPINDPRWNNNRPGDKYNCKCSLDNTDKPVTLKTITPNYKPDAGLETNPASTGAVFSDKHPYEADVKSKRKKKAITKFAEKEVKKQDGKKKA